MSEVPVIIAEVTAADWSDAGTGWTHLPYLARFRADRLPLSWEGFFTGRHHAVLESGRSGSFTIAVPAAARATPMAPTKKLPRSRSTIYDAGRARSAPLVSLAGPCSKAD
jgi:hypothetical protein